MAWSVALAACTTNPQVTDAGITRDAAVDVSFDVATPYDAASNMNAFDAADEDASIGAMTDKGMAMIEEAAVLFDANKNDCSALGRVMLDYATRNDDFITNAKQVYGTMPAADRKALQKRVRTRFDAAWKKLQPTMKKCKDDENMKQFLDRIF